MTFNRLRNQIVNIDGQNRDCNFWSSVKNFNSILKFDKNTLKKVLQFSYDMTFGNVGIHRDHRSGGTHRRKNGELFIPKMKSFKVKELANKISKNHKIIGLRQGEKMNEVLISDEEKKLGKEHNDMWIVRLYNN